ncbi:MAG: hypothetical protein K2X47_10800 [Bdellovibrionales bacterium]|nr:hypothetical protein [Bdellovibrionales bacterium]
MINVIARIAKEECLKVFRAVNDFLYAPRDLMSLGLMRLVLGFSLCGFYAVRLVDFDLLFTERGYVTFDGAKALFPDFYRPLIHLFVQNEALSYFLHVSFLVTLFLMGLGIGGRILTIICYTLHVMFLNRNYAVVYGPDFLATVWLLCMCFVKTEPNLTLRVLRTRNWNELFKPRMESDLFSLLGHRLMQAHLCVVYLYGGLEKFRGQSWWDGSALWKVMGNGQYTQIDFSWLAWTPALVALLTYFAAFWETFFPVIVWSKRARGYIFGMGILLHGGISVMMGLVFFSFITVLGYFTFIDAEDILRWRRRLGFSI